MSPARPIAKVRDRDWRIHLKAALDAAFGDAANEPIPPSINDTVRGLK